MKLAMNRIIGSNLEEAIRSKIINDAVTSESYRSRIFYIGQVVNNKDPKNLNRVKIRIPIIDEQKFVDVSKEEGISKLSWCLPISHRFVEIPENNSIIICAILDPQTPDYGRLYFDTITEDSTDDIFDRLSPEAISLSNWKYAEQAFNILIKKKPSSNEYDAQNNVNYEVGLRGKGNNKFLLDKDYGLWIQNAKDKQNESFMLLKDDTYLEAAKNLMITSKEGKKENFHPVFHKPLYEYLASVNQMIQKIVTLLNTKPAISHTGPCLPSPNATSLISELKSLSGKLKKLTNEGNSEKIIIN